jgi:hypothetical protein
LARELSNSPKVDCHVILNVAILFVTFAPNMDTFRMPMQTDQDFLNMFDRRRETASSAKQTERNWIWIQIFLIRKRIVQFIKIWIVTGTSTGHFVCYICNNYGHF